MNQYNNMKDTLFFIVVLLLTAMVFGGLGYGVGSQLKLGSGGALIVTDPASFDTIESTIKAGKHHFICGFDTLASGASTTFAVLPKAANGYVHMMFQVESSGILEIEVYEGGATTTAGTPGTPTNSNRNSYATSTLMVTKGAFVSGATLLFEQKYGASGQFTRFGGTGSREDELILRTNTLYYFKFISGAADNIVTYCGQWYEEPIL